MSLEFLSIGAESDARAVARSPMAAPAGHAGARWERRGAWEVAVAYGGDPASESVRATGTVAFADSSHLTKLELQGAADALDSAAAAAGAALRLGEAVRAPGPPGPAGAPGAWWCRLTPTRALVIGEAVPRGAELEAPGMRVADVTSAFGAATVLGPLATELFARFCALDLRSQATPVGALRPGSIARQPGVLIREAEQRFLFLFGAAYGEYIWATLADAAGSLGGGPLGLHALAAFVAEETRGPTRA
jgi:heterotetrameric sarcosine oxidase gamma subunit